MNYWDPIAFEGLLHAQHAEMQRALAAKYRSKQPKPYYLSYLSKVGEKYSVWSRFGGSMAPKQSLFRNCFADIRVGSPDFDHIELGGLTDNQDDADSVELMELPLQADPEALRYAIWRLTDARYKEAAKAYHEKLSRLAEYEDASTSNSSLSNFQKAGPDFLENDLRIPRGFFDVCSGHAPESFEKWQTFTQEASLVAKPFADVWSSYVEFQAQTYYSLFLSSEGVLRIQKRHTYGLLGYYWLKAGGKNGVDLDGTLSYWVPNASELPDLKTFCSSLKERLETVQELKGAKRLRSYSGPVLLSAKPAGLLVHEVLGHRVESSRLLSDEEGHTFADKLGEKVTHPDLVIYDDPTATEFAGTSLVGHYQFDDEGVDAGKAQLIDKGTLTGYLCTRSPIAHQNPDAANQQNTAKHQSTGHARNESFQRPIARMANLFILPEGGLPFAELKKEFIDVLKKAGRKYGLWILDVEGGETGTESYDFQAFKGEVLLAKKIHIDGSEEWVRGVDLVGTPLSSLSAITRLGKELEVDNGFCGAESGTIPVSTISPAMIVQKLELQSKEQRRAQLPVTSIPWQT